MRIRTLLLAATMASAALGLGAVVAVVQAGREELRTNAVRTQAQVMAHEVSGLLVLTQDYARHAEPRAAEQWRRRHAAIAGVLSQGATAPDAPSVLNELRSVSSALPELFSALEKVPTDGSAFSLRRKEVLLDQLLTSTQAMSDYAYQWYQDTSQARQLADERFQVYAFATVTGMLLLLLLLVVLVFKRVLGPLQRLDEATVAISRGELPPLLHSTKQDEMGDLKRRFDQMTLSLARSSQQLQQSEKRLRMMADNLPTLIAYIDREGRYQFVNDQFHRMFGLDPAALQGRTVAEALGPAAYAPLQQRLEAALAGERQRFERVSEIGGRERCLLTDYIPDLAEDGSVSGIFAMALDITDRRQGELLREQSEQRLRAITNNIPALVGHFDAQERCLFANETILKLRDIAPEDARRHTLHSGLGDENYALHEPFVRRVLQGEACGFEGRVQRDGKDVYFQAHLVPDRGAQGQVQGFFLMSFDVTRVRRAEVARKRSEERLRQITDNLPVLIGYFDKGLQVEFANATYGAWMGADLSSKLGQHVSDFIGPALFEARKTYIARALAGERVEFESELPAGREGSEPRSLSTVFIPDFDADGAVQGFYALSSDISAIKSYERQLMAMARVDTLTGLPNRLQFNERMAETLERTRRNGGALALMFLDVDRFKSINDTLGHAAGDIVLKEFAKRVRGSVRQVDRVARLAGDEFVVVLEGLHGRDEASAVARKIVNAVSLPMDLDGQTLLATTSVGIAYVEPGAAAVSAAELLGRADAALYEAKRAGRNTFHLA